MKHIQPLRDNILIKIITDLPNNVVLTEDLLKQKIQNSPKAEVIATGESVKDVQVGDMVYFQKWQKSEVSGFEQDGSLFALIKEEHIDAKYV